jgi:two-component system, OmpR family, sensor kinase
VSIRLRVALVFTLVLAFAVALGSWLLISQLSSQLQTALDTTVKAQLAPYRSARSVTQTRFFGVPDNSVAQVISPSGKVIVNRAEDTTGPILNPAQVKRARTGLTATAGDERYRFFAAPVGRTGAIAVVGVSTEGQVSKPLSNQITALVIAGALFVLLGALGAYWLAAAALSPVERMRRQVASLSAQDAAVGVQVPRTKDELAALAGTMNDLLVRLHEALARQRGFVADASHELRTPLAVLGAELELAQRPGRSKEDLARAVSSAEDEVARLTRLTNDLLMLAGSDEGRLPVRLTPTDLRPVLERCTERAGFRAAEAGISCVIDAPDFLVIPVDGEKIGQAVDNLIDNALRFAPAGSVITVSASARGAGEGSGTGRTGSSWGGGGAVIEVADAGPGFPPEFLPYAFERFRRPDTGRARSDGGSGLGLAIVAAIARAHGGTASARNRETGGAVVTLDLPARGEDLPANEAPVR